MKHDMTKQLVRVCACVVLVVVVAVLAMPKGDGASSGAAAAEQRGEAIYNPGEYSGKGEGFGGSVKTTITVDEYAITAVTVDAATETAEIGQAAVEILVEQVLEAQSAEIDGVTGASLTSDAVKKGIEQALEEAVK